MPIKLNANEGKMCLICNSIFSKKPRETYKYWATKKYCSYSCLYIAQKKTMVGSSNPNWKSTTLAKGGPLHRWIKRRLEKPDCCNHCRKSKRLDLANISGQYSQTLTDWTWLCRSCHQLLDGRQQALKKQYKGNNNFIGTPEGKYKKLNLVGGI